MYISDNIGYLYAYDFKKNKIIWGKNYKVPFRSNIKVKGDKLFVADQNNNLFIINKLNGDIISRIPTEEVFVKNKYENKIALSGNDLFF